MKVIFSNLNFGSHEKKLQECQKNQLCNLTILSPLFAERDPTKKMKLLGYAKKLAHRHAYENAFKRVIIISLDNGKVGVEINMQDIPECSLDESGEEGIVQINYLEEMPFSDSEDEKNSEIEFQDTSNTLLDTHVIDVSS